MTEQEKQAKKTEADRWAKEARDMFAPPGAHKKGSHQHPSPYGSGTPGIRQVKPLGHEPTYRRLRE